MRLLAPSVLSLPAVLVLSVCSSASAQATNLFEVYPDEAGTSLSFTSRFTLGPAAGENLVGVLTPEYARVGDFALPGGKQQVQGYRGAHQDQDASTQETYYIVVRKGAQAGGPDVNNTTGRVARIGPMTTPKGQGTQAWLITVSFATEVDLPNNESFYFGIEHTGADSWPADGMSTHIAHYSYEARGDNPRVDAPNRAWTVVPSRTPDLEQPTPRTARIGLLTTAPVLGVGGIDASNTRQSPTGSVNYGAGGMWPDVNGKTAGRYDDLALRLRDAGNPNGFATVMVSAGYLATGLPFPGFHGVFSLAPPFSFHTVLLLDGEGTTEARFLLGQGPNPLRSFLGGQQLFWQALVFDRNLKRPAFTNVAAHNM